MSTLKFLLFSTLSILFSAPAFNQQLLNKTIMADGMEREYLLYVPAAYDGSEDWPLVVNIHAYNSTPQEQIEKGMNVIADTAHFLVAYPEGLPVDIFEIPDPPMWIPPGLTGWNLGADMSDNDDVAFIDSMITRLQEEYNINESRIYATGFSLGAIMSQKLACELPGRLAAIAPVAGTKPMEDGVLGWSCDPPQPIAMMLIHGTNDVVNSYAGGVELNSAEATINFWRSHNSCESGPTVNSFDDIDTTDESTVTRFKYSNCNQSTEVWLYRVNEGGHTWPGAPPPSFDVFLPVNRDINASSEIWNFFNRHSLGTINHTEALSAYTLKLRAFPNPASSRLTFEFELPEAAQVNITLYTPLGQPLQILAEENLPAGQQQIVWQRPEEMPAGLYYYRLQLDEQSIARALVLK